MKTQNVSLFLSIFTTCTQLNVAQAFYCKPTAGNITTLFKDHHCGCLYDDQGSWIVYDKDLIFPPFFSAQQNDSKLNNTTSSPDSTIHVNDDEEIKAISTYDGVKSTCIIRHSDENYIDASAAGGKQLVYCPFNVLENSPGRNNITLVVTRSRRRTLNSNNKTLITTTTTSKWASYVLPTQLLYCKCGFSQMWTWKMLQWDSIQVDWKISKTVAKYISTLTAGAQTKVFFKQGDSGGGGSSQNREVCEESTTKDYQCKVHQITELVDIRRTFAICVETTIASCWYPSSEELCKDVTLKPDSVWNHFKFVESQSKCHTNDGGDDGGTHISWATENPMEIKPSGLVYSISLLNSDNHVIVSKILSDPNARSYTHYGHDTKTVTSARVNLCVHSSFTAATRKCGSTKSFQCTHKENSLLHYWFFFLVIPVILGIVGVAHCIHRRSKKTQELPRIDGGCVDVNIIMNECYNKDNRQKLENDDETKYEEVYHVNESDIEFDTIDIRTGSGT